MTNDDILCIFFSFRALFFLTFFYRYEAKMRQTEERMRALGLLTPSCVLTLDEWEIPRDRVVINRKLGEGAFGTVYGGEAFFDEKGWVSTIIFQFLESRDHLVFLLLYKVNPKISAINVNLRWFILVST